MVIDDVSEFMSKAPFNNDNKDVEFEDIRKSKKRKKNIDKENNDVIIDNNEGFEITRNSSNYIDFDKKFRKKWLFDPEKNIEKWTTWDFFSYTRNLYNEKYNTDWNLNRFGCSKEIQNVINALKDEFSQVNNVMIKDFISFFFSKYVDSFKYKYKDFYFAFLKRKDILKSFHNQYNCKNVSNKQNVPVIEKFEISEKEIEKTYLLGENSLLCNYGVIITVNFLINKNVEKDKIVKSVINSCNKLCKKGIINEVIKSTEKYSPYPMNLEFKEIEQVFSKIDKNIKMNISFEKNEKNKLDFLMKGD